MVRVTKMRMAQADAKNTKKNFIPICGMHAPCVNSKRKHLLSELAKYTNTPNSNPCVNYLGRLGYNIITSVAIKRSWLFQNYFK